MLLQDCILDFEENFVSPNHSRKVVLTTSAELARRELVSSGYSTCNMELMCTLCKPFVMYLQKYNRRRRRVRQSEKKYFAHVKVCHMTEEESEGESTLIMRPISWRSDGNLPGISILILSK